MGRAWILGIIPELLKNKNKNKKNLELFTWELLVIIPII
jgi:hypothetical protein